MSTYSSMEIVIVNPLLLEILQKYKDLGVWGDAELPFKIGESDRPEAATPAFALDWALKYGNVPGRLADVLDELVSVCDGFVEDEALAPDAELYQQMKDELHRQSGAIGQQFQYVSWHIGEQSNEDVEVNGEPYDGTVQEDETFVYTPEGGEQHSETQEILN